MEHTKFSNTHCNPSIQGDHFALLYVRSNDQSRVLSTLTQRIPKNLCDRDTRHKLPW